MCADSSDEDVPFESTGSTSAADLKKDASTSKDDSGFMDEYSDTLIHELQQTSLAKSFASAGDIVEVTKVYFYLFGFCDHVNGNPLHKK